MKRAGRFGSLLVAITAGVTIVGADTANASSISGYGYVGSYWCEADSELRLVSKKNWVRIWVTGSDFNNQGQTMQFKIVDGFSTGVWGYSGWFAVPNSGYRDVALVGGREGALYSFKICATFGGGTPNKAYRWWGNLDYDGSR